jgi:hypothetical protein
MQLQLATTFFPLLKQAIKLQIQTGGKSKQGMRSHKQTLWDPNRLNRLIKKQTGGSTSIIK